MSKIANDFNQALIQRTLLNLLFQISFFMQPMNEANTINVSFQLSGDRGCLMSKDKKKPV